ncbi:MAG TPA: DUF721 domain-containing protein [Acidobacteriota bacterium]|nr:DUF721 domain-containing protein [Acidobacteriota bacterium]
MQPIHIFLSSLLKEASKDPERTLIFLKELWPQIVGQEFGRKTQPTALRGNRLTLTVTDETWLEEGQQLADTIRNSINRYWGLPLIEKLRFKLHPGKSD